jgi:hypothetical protein
VHPNFSTFFHRLKNAVDVSFVSKSCKCWQYENRQENRALFTPQEMLPVRRTLVIRWKCLETKTNRRSEHVYYYTIPSCQRTRHKDHRHCPEYTWISASSRHAAKGPSWHHQCTSQNHRSATRKRSKRWEMTFLRRWIQWLLSCERCTLVHKETFRKHLLPRINDHQFFLNICTYEKIDRVENTLMCTIAEAYVE